MYKEVCSEVGGVTGCGWIFPGVMIMPPAPDPFTPLDPSTSCQPPTEPSGNNKLIEMDTNTQHTHSNIDDIDIDTHSHYDSHDSLHDTSTSLPRW